MIVVDVVLEVQPLVGFTAWPISELASYQFLSLSDQMAPIDVGTAVAVIFDYNGITIDASIDLDASLLDRHLAETEALIAQGGLRFRDTAANAEFLPGCCFGLECWREWQDVLHGESIFLGHSPDPRLEHGDGVIRLWQDGRDESSVPTVQIDLSDLPGLLATSQRQFEGFLGLVRAWADDTAPQLASKLVAAFDKYFRIKEPLKTSS
jgi:hypothetical protein